MLEQSKRDLNRLAYLWKVKDQAPEDRKEVLMKKLEEHQKLMKRKEAIIEELEAFRNPEEGGHLDALPKKFKEFLNKLSLSMLQLKERMHGRTS